jgi:hypothetical protein
MKKLIKILFLTSLLANVSAQTLTAKFDSKNHPKAKGVWASTHWPVKWAPVCECWKPITAS